MGQPSGGGQIPAGSLRQHDDVLRWTPRTFFLLFFVTVEPADKRVALLVLRRPALLVDRNENVSLRPDHELCVCRDGGDGCKVECVRSYPFFLAGTRRAEYDA